MIWIDLEHKLPTDADLPPAVRWTQADWDAWLAESQRLVGELARLNAVGLIKERNKFIDNHSAHWGKLKPWLQALSDGKCWFSEVRELYSHYDVEHFRPKKEAKELDATERDGYWWLAFDYMNFRLCGNVGNRKKGGWFPLQEGSRCSSYACQCEEDETAYLLDPIDIEDVNLLAFDEEGRAIARPDATAWESQRVQVTVERLKLNDHPALPEARRKIWTKVSGLIADYQRNLARSRNGGNATAKQKAKEAAQQVHELTRPTAELSAVAKWCVLFRNDPQLARLVS